MTARPAKPGLLLQYTSVRTRVEGGRVFIGLKITAKDAAGLQHKTEWIEMPPGDAAGLARTIQEALAALPAVKHDVGK